MDIVDGYVGFTVSDNPKASPLGAVLHSQINCPSIRKPENLVLARAQDTDAGLVVTYRGYSALVRECIACPPSLEWEWQERAACRSTYPEVDMLGPEIDGYGVHRARALIEEYCDNCPVVLQCLEFGAAQGAAALGIHGGIYFHDIRDAGKDVRGMERRREAIDTQRVRIESRFQ